MGVDLRFKNVTMFWGMPQAPVERVEDEPKPWTCTNHLTEVPDIPPNEVCPVCLKGKE